MAKHEGHDWFLGGYNSYGEYVMFPVSPMSDIETIVSDLTIRRGWHSVSVTCDTCETLAGDCAQ